jgi:DNA-directed RNA polymerase specialized sigma24 family protein
MIERELVMLARAGDDQARDRLIELCLDAARPIAISFSRSTDIAAEDLLQEVALKLWVKWPLVLGAGEPLGPVGYAKALAKCTLINRYQRVAKRRSIARMVSLDCPFRDTDLAYIDLIPGGEVWA